MLARILRPFANAALRTELRELHARLDDAMSRLRVQDLEIALLTDVVARDRKRVRAETAAATRRIAEAESGEK
jgi:hypothetical protein